MRHDIIDACLAMPGNDDLTLLVKRATALSETLDAEEVSSLINALWQRLDAVVLHHGGRIDKHIGDAVMALFGAPMAREDDPERAIRSGR